MKLCVIIPTFNEESTLGRTLEHVREAAFDPDQMDIIVVDGCSTDRTREVAGDHAAQVVISDTRGRASQMNAGAFCGRGSLLYFLHADSLPPKHFDRLIKNAWENGYQAGCFRMKFDRSHPLLSLGSWFTRFNWNVCRGGDQSLFMTTRLFDQVNGFSEGMAVMEDIDIVRRLKCFTPFKIIPEEIVTSARKFQENGVFKLYCCFSMIHMLYWVGFSQRLLVAAYRVGVDSQIAK